MDWQGDEKTAAAIANGEGASVASLDAKRRPYRNNSYLTAYTIIRENDRNVLGKRKIEFNEMSGDVELSRRPLRDIDTGIIKGEIERLFSIMKDRDGNEVGLKVTDRDIEMAIRQVAAENPYQPVREYLEFQSWDGVERISHVVGEILNGDDTPINRLLVRKFFISAVARAFEPGCKVDTMLILQGVQGAMKSTFFKALTDPWFVDTVIDISSDATRAYMIMRKAWIIEWAELESLFRARDASSVKAFLSSSSDTYVPKFGRNSVEVKRQGVIVGTINPDEFLTDDTGARRFWPVKVGNVNLPLAHEWRDQLWAEAVVAYRAKEPWHLTAEEEAQLLGAHEEHRVRDAWEDEIARWSKLRESTFTTADVLTSAIDKPAGQWSRSDEMRVAKVLKAIGFERRTDAANVKRKVWVRK